MLFVLSLAALLTAGASCSGSVKETEATEETVAEIEAAQMEGRNAAKGFVNKQWPDTMHLQQQLLEARAAQSRYVLAKKPRCAAAFDSTFVHTLRSVRPDIAAQIK